MEQRQVQKRDIVLPQPHVHRHGLAAPERIRVGPDRRLGPRGRAGGELHREVPGVVDCQLRQRPVREDLGNRCRAKRLCIVLRGRIAGDDHRRIGAAGLAPLADELDVSMDDYYRIMDDVSSAALLSLDEMAFGDDDDKPVPLLDTLSAQNQPSAEANLERVEMRNLLADSLGQVSEQERLVVALYYYEQLTLKEIGQVLELSESRVSQLHTKAVLGLRAKLRKRFMA